jgi:hypothetical protein
MAHSGRSQKSANAQLSVHQLLTIDASEDAAGFDPDQAWL